MVKNYETVGGGVGEQTESAWNELEKMGKDEVDIEKGPAVESAGSVTETRREKVARVGAKVRAAYAAGERERVERLKADLDAFRGYEYERRAIATEPSATTKVLRMLADKLGVKTKRGEERREREAMHVALTEHREEEAVRERGRQERIAREEAERAQRESRRKAENEQREQEALARDMSEAGRLHEFRKHERYQKQRTQEIVEQDLNARLLTVDNLETETLAENPGVERRAVVYEGEEIPVYDLKGLPFAMLSTTIDYRKANKPGEIGTETYRAVMADPAVWAERRDEAEKASGFGTRKENARGDTISASYYNSERNLASRVPGDLIYGFEKVAADSVIMVANGDGGTSNMAGRIETRLRDPDEIKVLEGAGGVSAYNEVLLRRYSENGMPKLPDYIIVENGRITEAAMRHAKFFKIPIVNVEWGIYREKAEKRGQELLDSISGEDSYVELDAKLAELLSMAQYKSDFRVLKGIGRNEDRPVLPMNATPTQEKCLEASKMEQRKRLEFIAETLQEVTKQIREATEKGKVAKNKLAQFDYFHVGIRDVQNGVRSTESGETEDRMWSAPGNSNEIEIDFRLRGSSRNVETRVYDGERIYRVDEALATGVRKQEDIDRADSSYYEKLEPIVREYFEAVRENEKLEEVK